MSTPSQPPGGPPRRPPPLPSSVGPCPSPSAATTDWSPTVPITFAGEPTPQSCRLRCVGTTLQVQRAGSSESETFHQQFQWGTSCLLVGPTGALALLPSSAAVPGLEPTRLAPHQSALRPHGDNAIFGLLRREGNQVRPVRLEFGPEAWTLDGRTYPYRVEDRLQVEHAGAGFSRIEFRPAPAETAGTPLTLLATERLAYAVWEEWDVARAQRGVETNDLNKLYQLYDDARRYNLLAVLFSDILLLNHELNRGTSMEEMAGRVEGGTQAGNIPDTVLREVVIAKTLTLTLALPRIKQKFELLASMYPYYWVHQEAEWLKAVFGRRITGHLLAGIRKKAVPLIRQQVRLLQANIRTPLGEIENAARSIDSLLSREEISKSNVSKLNRYAPAALQGLSALMMLSGAGPVLSLAQVATTGTMVSFLGSGIIGNLTRNVLEDRQAAMQIQRAAEAIFPWWNVFMRTLVVSVFEANQFIDDLTQQTNRRDRELFEKIPPPEQPQVREQLATVLRQRIVEEKRNRFAEMLEGSGLRLHRVIGDIEQIISREMKAGVDEFISELHFGAPSAPPRTSGNDASTPPRIQAS